MKRKVSGGKSIGKKIIYVSIGCILAAVVTTAGVMFAGNSSSTDLILADDTKAALSSLTRKTASMASSAATYASDLASGSVLTTALRENQKSSIAGTIKMAAKDIGADVDFVTVTDPKGVVLASTESDQSGESLASQKSMKEAMAGSPSKGYLEQGDDVKLAVRAAAPLEDGGEIIGFLSTGYDMGEPALLDELKQANNCDFTVFLGDTRLNTTIASGGKRGTGTKAPQSVTDTVVGRKKPYSGETSILGNSYYAQYAPLTDAGGKTVGMLFAGKPVANIAAIRNRFLLLTIATAVLISVLSILIFNLFSKKSIASPIRKMSGMAAELAEGKLSGQELAVASRDEIGLLAQSLQTMSGNLQRYIGDISRQLTVMARGDMTAEFQMEYLGDFMPIKTALQQISDSLNRTLAQIGHAARQVNGGANQVSSASQELAKGAVEQAASIEELSASIENVSRKVSETTGKVRGMMDAISQAVDDVENSSQKAADMLAAMTGIQESSDKIEKIIQSIDDIAFQTNILALNAAVEAARAGNAGKGFAVVADEVRNLAAKSAQASKETAALIQDTLAKVHNGFELAEETAESSRQISRKLQQVTEDMDSIKQASASQASAVSQITAGIGKVSSIVETTSANAEESAATSKELSEQAALLRGEVEKFRLKSAEE